MHRDRGEEEEKEVEAGEREMGEGGGGEEKAVYIDAVLWKHSPRTNPLLNLKNK